MSGFSHLEINESALRELLAGRGGPVVRTVQRYTGKTANTARSKAPVDTGKGRGSIDHEVEVSGLVVRGRVWTPLPYMRYQHDGTGIYGPRGTPIRPKTAKVLVFKAGRSVGPLPKGKRHAAPSKRGLVFAMEVKGVPPNPFLVDALEQEVPWPVTRHN